MNIVQYGNGYDGEEAANGRDVPAVLNGDDGNELITFGDFSDKDYDTYFSSDTIQNVSVQFICDTYNATKSWVEEGCKHTFMGLEPVDDGVNTFFEAEGEPGENNLVSESDSLPGESTPLPNGFDTRDPCDEAEYSDLATPVENGLSNSEADLTSDTEKEVEKEVVVEEIKKPEPAKKPVSWASLFKSSESVDSATTQSVVVSAPKAEEELSTNYVACEAVNGSSVSMISMKDDERAWRLATFINGWHPDYSHHPLQLRGLINRANWCYINATLQSLLAVPTIYHFYKKLGSFANAKSTSIPLNDSMIAFFTRFEPIEKQLLSKKENQEINIGTAFEPTCVYDVLTLTKSSLSEKGRQEDAEEFLSFLLNGIHEELVALKKLVQPKAKAVEEGEKNGILLTEPSSGEEDAWEQVGPKNKGRTVRKAVCEESLMKHVFGGVICSSVLQTGVKESSTFQPFFTLQLDIQSEEVQTLNDAIKFYFTKEKLQGFTCAKTKAEVDASRRISLEELPLIFIFHLKYFVFDPKGGIQKIHKEIDIPVDLEIPKDIVSHNKNASYANMRRYRLHAVVYHHGQHAAGGHYTASVNHGSPFGWVHFDDNQIKNVSMNQLVKHHAGIVPYLLLYERIQHK